MKKTGLIILLIIVVALYATNPTKVEFNEFAEEFIKSEVKASGVDSNSFFTNLVAAFAGEIASRTAGIAVTGDEYYLFSVYSVKGVELDYDFVGIFRKFIPIRREVNPARINQLFRDTNAILNDEIQLREDYYRTEEVTIHSPSEITIKTELISGPPIEVLFVDRRNYEKWLKRMQGQSEVDIQYYPPLSIIVDGTGKKTEQIDDKGTYYFIF